MHLSLGADALFDRTGIYLGIGAIYAYDFNPLVEKAYGVALVGLQMGQPVRNDGAERTQRRGQTKTVGSCPAGDKKDGTLGFEKLANCLSGRPGVAIVAIAGYVPLVGRGQGLKHFRIDARVVITCEMAAFLGHGADSGTGAAIPSTRGGSVHLCAL